MRISAAPDLDLDFATIDHPAIDLRTSQDQLTALIAVADAQLAAAATPDVAAGWAVAAVLLRVATGTTVRSQAPALRILGSWMRGDPARQSMFWFVASETTSTALPDLAAALLDADPASVAAVWLGGQLTTGDVQEGILRSLVGSPDPGVRQHCFELLGQHRRLVPPGSIPRPRLPGDALAGMLRAGATDPVSKIRERAIAAAFGMGVVAQIRPEVVACTEDPVMDTRQYALVALGTLDDTDSLELLRRKLTTGADPEIASAISALARRPDGVDHVLALAGDSRPWVQDELVAAVARVSAPLDEDRLAALAARLTHPGLAEAIEAHRRRVAPGGREYGPDGVAVVVRASASANAR